MQLSEILYLEDEPDIRQVVGLVLSSQGITVHGFASTAEAIQAAPDLAPELVLLDVMMPEMNGFDSLRELRKLPDYENLPAVFLTAREEPDASVLEDLAPAAVITKPFEPSELGERLQTIYRNLRLGD